MYKFWNRDITYSAMITVSNKERDTDRNTTIVCSCLRKFFLLEWAKASKSWVLWDTAELSGSKATLFECGAGGKSPTGGLPTVQGRELADHQTVHAGQGNSPKTTSASSCFITDASPNCVSSQNPQESWNKWTQNFYA